MYPVESTVSTVAHKVYLLIQMELGRVELTNVTGHDRQRLRAETSRVLDMMHRLIRTVIECKGSDADGRACWAALELARSMAAKAWENKPMQLLQVPQLGPVLMRKLVSHNIRTVSQLADSDPGDIERISSRNPPFGRKMADSLAFFPRLTLGITIRDSKVDSDGQPVIYIDGSLGFSNTRGKWQGKMPIVTFLAVTAEGVSSYFCRESLSTFNQSGNTLRIHFTWTPNSFQETLSCRFACEEIVGTVVSTEIRHKLPTSAFPPRNKKSQPSSTRSRKSVQPQMPSAGHGFEDELDDDEMLEILEEITRKGALNKRAEIETDFEDDDLFTMLDGSDNRHSQTRPSQNLKSEQGRGSESLADQGYPHLEQMMLSSRAPQHNAGVSTKKQNPQPRGLPRHSESSHSHIVEPIEDNPIRLANGRYKCGHPCSHVGGGTTARGDKCGHDCCRNGSKHPPKKHNSIGKRKDHSSDGFQSDTQPVPDFSSSNRPPKRTEKNSATQSTAEAQTPPPFPSRSRPHLSRKRSLIDLSLCDVDEEGIIDLTCDYETRSTSPRHATASRLGRTGGEPSAVKKMMNFDNMLDGLSDDDFIGIGIASEPKRPVKDKHIRIDSRNSTDYSRHTSSKVLKEVKDKNDFDVTDGPIRMITRVCNGDQERDLGAARRGKSGSMRRSEVANDSFIEVSSPPLSKDETVPDEICAYDEQAIFSPTAPQVIEMKTRHSLGRACTAHETSAMAAGPQGERLLVSDSIVAKSKGNGEPQWVDDFDSALISEFRGLVDFV